MAAQKPPLKNFINFMKDVKTNEPLLKAFIETESKDELEAFFKKHHYTVDSTDLKNIWELKEESGVDSWPPPPHY